MEYATLTTESIVKAATQGEYAVPEFQRGFVWTTRQVLDFVDSLSRSFPVGSILTWKSDTVIQRGDNNQTQQKSWLIDGQQRTTALCTLFGSRPFWWDYNQSGTWAEHLSKFDVRLDISAKELTFAVRHSLSSKQYVSVSKILKCENIFTFAQQLVADYSTYTDDVGEIAQHLQQVANIKKSILPIVEIDDNIEVTEVAEIFKRLNSTGTRVQQADIYLGVVASRNPGWVNQNFLTFMHELSESGFEIEPAFLFRSFTAIGASKSRYKDIPSGFWDNPDQDNAWNSTKKALRSVCHDLREYGIINSDLALSLNAIVAASIYRAKFPQGSFGPFLAWMICSIDEGFFSGPIETRLDQLIGRISQSDSSSGAIAGLYQLIDEPPSGESHFKDKDFIETRSGSNSVHRLMIYLMAYRNDAQDWDTDGYRIRAEAVGQYRPEWHHIFPRKWLRDNVPNIENPLIDNVANMAVISGEANRRIAASNPKKYVAELNLAKRGMLNQQVVPDPTFVNVEQYEDWLKIRAQRLAEESNKHLAELRGQNPNQAT